MTMQRRHFLRRLGAAGATLAGLPLLAGRAAHAGGAAPTRLLVWYQPNGYGEDPGAVHARTLQTLDAYRNKTLYVRGMHLPTADGGHEVPMETMLVGESSGPSFDQQIAEALGDATSVSTLALGVRSEPGGHGGHCSFLSGNNPTPRIERPEDTWATVFAGLDAEGDPEAQAELQALWDRRGRMLDGSAALAEATRDRVPSKHRAGLDAHVEALEDIRDEMTSTADTSETCVVPAAPADTPQGAWNDHSNFDEIAAGQIEMMSHALACDVTRVGVLQFHRSTSQIQFGQVDGGDYLDQHHALSHMPTETEAQDQLQQILDWYDARLLELMTALDSTIDVDGSTVLDNTIIVRVTECMESNGHTFSSGHHLVLGGGNVLQTGQDVVVPDDEPLWKLWRTLADAMGVELPSVAGYEGAGYEDLLA